MTPIETSSDDASEPRIWWRFILWPVVVVVVYILSLGPVVRWVGMGPPVVRAFYTPLIWAHDRVPPFRVTLDKYMRLWEEHR